MNLLTSYLMVVAFLSYSSSVLMEGNNENLEILEIQSNFFSKDLGNLPEYQLQIKDCKFKDIPLYGKVKFVESFGDIKIKFVKSFPDIKVKYVSSFPNDCGKWQVVESFPDFTIQIVESFADLKVEIVETFPGM